ncbi:MAG TPA: hypothetical protein PKE65_09155 [Rhizobiaceae bacterium]|nr:hypothetical protein [Rhizobiaceae bacterium]
MISARATLLSTAMVLGILFWGMAVYSDDAIAGKVPSDGYGVSALVSD